MDLHDFKDVAENYDSYLEAMYRDFDAHEGDRLAVEGVEARGGEADALRVLEDAARLEDRQRDLTHKKPPKVRFYA